MSHYHNRHLIITHADDPSGRDPVTIITRCYWEIIESRSLLPEEIITTTTTSITTKGDLDDVVTIDGDDETTSASTAISDRAVNRSRIESSVEEEEATVVVHEQQPPVVKSRNCYPLILSDTTGPHDMLSRTTVKEGDITYVTIHVTLAHKIDENRFDSTKGDEQEVFKHLFLEIVDYLDNNEAELFLFNVIEDIINMIGKRSIHLKAALKALDLFYLATGDKVKKEQLKKDTDIYLRWTLDELKEKTAQILKELTAKRLKEEGKEAVKSEEEEVTYKK